MAVKKGIGELIGLGPVNVAGKTVTVKQTNITPPNRPQVSEVNVAVTEIVNSMEEVETISSLGSVEVFHSTIFDSFNIAVSASYNFYEENETVEFPNNNIPINELPRYVTISWKTTPAKQKILKNFDRDGFSFPVPHGDIGVSVKSLSNGFISPGVISAVVESNKTTKNTIRFVDPGIVGTLSDSKKLTKATKAEHLSSIENIASIITGLEVISEVNQNTRPTVKPPEFKSPASFLGVHYIGYVIEKYDVSSGKMQFLKSIEIDDPEIKSFVDREILYGRTYSYRIRSIVRWTRNQNEGFFGKNVTDRTTQFSQVAGLLDKISSFYGGDWSVFATAKIADLVLPDHPDEFRVDISSTNKIHVSWKIPHDSQRDISNIVVLKKIETSSFSGDWEEVMTTTRRNGLYIENDISVLEDPSARIIYSSITKTVHDEHSNLSEQYTCNISGGKLVAKMSSPSSNLQQKNEQKPTARKSIDIAVNDKFVEYPIFSGTKIVRLTSLATGQRIDLSIIVSAVDIGNRSEVKTKGVGPTLSTLKGT